MPSAWILVAPKMVLSISFNPLVYQKPNCMGAVRPASMPTKPRTMKAITKCLTVRSSNAVVVFRVLAFMADWFGTALDARVVAGEERVVFRPRFAAAQMLGEQRHHENPGQAETDGEGNAEHIHSCVGGPGDAVRHTGITLPCSVPGAAHLMWYAARILRFALGT